MTTPTCAELESIVDEKRQLFWIWANGPFVLPPQAEDHLGRELLAAYGAACQSLGEHIGRERAEAERDRLRDALVKYGKHPRKCEERPWGCKCGLQAALDATV